MVTPGIRPLMLLELFVTVKAPGPLPTVIAALAAAVTVVSWPISEKALVAMFIVLSAPGEVACTDRLNWFVPVLMADADRPTPAELIASTTELRLPLPVLTSAALIDPIETAPVNVAVTVEPFAPFRVTGPPGEKLLRSFDTPSTVTIPSVPLAVEVGVLEKPRPVAAVPPVTWKEVALP